jgi:hypothetical protein
MLPANINYYLEEVGECDYMTPCRHGLDTCVRDSVFDDIAEYFTGRSWPLNMDNVDFEEFHASLENAISEKG